MNPLIMSILAVIVLSMAFTMNISRSVKQNNAFQSHIAPAVITASVIPGASAGVDLLGFDGGQIVLTTGALVGAFVGNVQLMESADNTTWTAVAAAQIESDIPNAVGSNLAAATTYRIGYLGALRYIALQINYVSGTSLAVAAVGHAGLPLSAPV